MESSAARNEQEPHEIHLNHQKCETENHSNLNIRQSSAWGLNNCLNICCTGFRSKKSQDTSNISRSQIPWHRPVTNCMFNSHFKDTNRIDEFKVEQLVAKGAFARVFQVFPKNESLECPLALKIIRKSKVIRNNCVQQIKDEADIQKLCGHHPFIVQQIDSWQDRRHLYILCEYVSNGELFSKIYNFTTELIRLYVAEIALAIDFLHNAGVIYRDAKPENILVTSNYHIKITDFGLSKWLKIGDKTRTMCGTYQYMAPEILNNEPYGHSVDWWALGVIACQMYANKGPNVEEILRSITSPETEPPLTSIKEFLPEEIEAVSPDGKDAVLRLLDINPKSRLHSVMSLQRIALYKNFQIELNYVQKISALDIIKNEGIQIRNTNEQPIVELEF